MRRPALFVLLPLVALSASGFSCGGGGGGGGATAGGGGAAAGGTLDTLVGWVRGWSDDASRGTRRPPNFEIPPPPAVELPATAAQIGEDVARAESPLTALRARVHEEDVQMAAEHTQSVLCEWFGWYVEDPIERPVPGSAEFFLQFTKSAMEVEFGGPPARELEEAVELFRNAIEKGQNLAEDLRFAAIAAACTAPLGG